MTYLKIILQNRVLRLSSIGLFLSGMTFAATMPLQSYVGIVKLHISPGHYSALIFISSTVSLIVGVMFGAASDLIRNRVSIIAPSAIVGAFGFLLIFIQKSEFAFFFAYTLLIPIGSTIYNTIFASIRVEAKKSTPLIADTLVSTIRAIFAISWVVVPASVSILLMLGADIMIIYLVAGLLSLTNAMMFLFASKPSNNSKGSWPSSALRASDAEKPRPSLQWDHITPQLLFRLVGVGILISAHRLQEIICPLIISSAGEIGDRGIGLYAGAVALVEIPMIFAWGLWLRSLNKSYALFIGAVLYAAYLSVLSFSQNLSILIFTIPLNAAGGAAILSVTISYLQELIVSRPGLSTSLSYVTSAIGFTLASVIFSMTPGIFTLSQVAIIAAGLSLFGGAIVLAMRHTKNI